MTFNPATLTDDDLRSAVIQARTRLPHAETCEHCAHRVDDDRREATNYRHTVNEFNEHAAAAGYLIPSKKTLVHRWDCSVMQTYLREVEDFTNSDDYEESVSHGYQLPLPRIATLQDARAFIGNSKARRGCKTCSPDLQGNGRAT